MKFKLRTLAYTYSLSEKLRLEKYGFTFEKIDEDWYNKLDYEVEISINTIEDLIKLSDDVNSELIFDGKTIKIYDGYNE